MSKITKLELARMIREVISSETERIPGLYREPPEPVPTRVNTKVEPGLARTARQTQVELDPVDRKTHRELPAVAGKTKGRRGKPSAAAQEVYDQIDAEIDDPFQYYLDQGMSVRQAANLFRRNPGQKAWDEENPEQAAERDRKMQPKNNTLEEVIRREIRNFLKSKA